MPEGVFNKVKVPKRLPDFFQLKETFIPTGVLSKKVIPNPQKVIFPEFQIVGNCLAFLSFPYSIALMAKCQCILILKNKAHLQVSGLTYL